MEVEAFENPLRAGIRLQRAAEPCIAVIFGASGDLAKRKLVPALYSLARQNLLGPGFTVLGTARSAMSDEEFRKVMRSAVEEFVEEGVGDERQWESFASGLFYTATDTAAPDSYEALGDRLKKLDGERGAGGNRLIYLSTPPSQYSPIVKCLRAHNLHRSENGGWIRIIVEKPFGRDLDSARALNRELLEVFSEDQIYRIDHYLGKETVQNIMVLRFANMILEPLWNRNYIDHVQITAAESIGVENRGGYYETSGAFRDMIQNHMLQLLALVAMEPPWSMDAGAVRDEKAKVIRAARDFTAETARQGSVRGQYGPGSIGGRPVPGYRQEKDVNPESQTETFAAARFYIDNWRWADVPFYLRSGKRLPKRVTEIAIGFREAPHQLFRLSTGAPSTVDPNMLVMRIQPEEGISLKFAAKLPGQSIQIRPVSMDFQYGTSFGKKSPEAYERLLLDAMLGDSTLYARGDFVEEAWALVMPILHAWEANEVPLASYESGTWGPHEADALMGEGRRWRRP